MLARELTSSRASSHRAAFDWSAGLLVLALASLSTGLELRTGGGILKPYDVLTVAALVLFMLSGDGRRYGVNPAILVLGLFLVAHTVSALSVSPALGIKKAIQAGLLLIFGHMFCSLDAARINRKHLEFAIGFIAVVMAFNIGWHLWKGLYSGWKHLDEPKSTFLILPSLLAAVIIVRQREKSVLYCASWGLLLVLVMMSGERKALISGLAILAVVYVRRDTVPQCALILGVASTAILLAYLSGSSYLTRQLDSLVSGSDRHADMASLAAGYVPTSISDAARRMSNLVAWQLFDRAPWFGVGVDGVYTYIRGSFDFSTVPIYLAVSVHNEPLRILVETGLVGLAFYLLMLAYGISVAAYHALLFLRRGDDRYLRIVTCLLLPMFLYLWSEGSGTEMFVVGLLVVTVPGKLAGWLVSAGARETLAGRLGARRGAAIHRPRAA